MLIGEYVFEPSVEWSYTTVVVRVDEPFGTALNFETEAIEWVPPAEVERRPLHPGFAGAWPHVRAHRGDGLSADHRIPCRLGIAERSSASSEAIRSRTMAMDLVIELDNEPGALARVAKAVSDAGVNIAAATCLGAGERAELHILVPHATAAKHALALSQLAVTREREVAVVEVDDAPGVLADLAAKVAKAGVNIELVYVATRNRVVFGAEDLDALKAALGV